MRSNLHLVVSPLHPALAHTCTPGADSRDDDMQQSIPSWFEVHPSFPLCIGQEANLQVELWIRPDCLLHATATTRNGGNKQATERIIVSSA